MQKGLGEGRLVKAEAEGRLVKADMEAKAKAEVSAEEKLVKTEATACPPSIPNQCSQTKIRLKSIPSLQVEFTAVSK